MPPDISHPEGTNWPTSTAETVVRPEGVTESERHLKRLCDHSFLSLWSYPGIFRDQGRVGGAGDGKEVCDLLVVFENNVLVFSDKACALGGAANDVNAWRRWYKRAVLKSAEQVWGAERWIRDFPNRLFLDRQCKVQFPITLPPAEKAKFHRIVVAHGASSACSTVFGGSGSLILQNTIHGDAHLQHPFTIGRIDPAKGYVHVFDDTSLEIVMKTLDTISDFVSYLTKKESLMTGPLPVFAAGEEELLARYILGMNEQRKHDFILAPGSPGLVLGEGLWKAFCGGSARKAQIDADKGSYLWDSIIEKVLHDLMKGSFNSTVQGISEHEKSFRWMARENRWQRRTLAAAFREHLEQTQPDFRASRIVQPRMNGDPYYVFLLLPHYPAWNREQYRKIRARMLGDYCIIVKLQFPDAQHVVGIAAESGDLELNSLDLAHFDSVNWTSELEKKARAMKRLNGVFTQPTVTTWIDREFPVVQERKAQISRNSPCLCGSGKRYKRCCGEGMFGTKRGPLFKGDNVR